jgi:hypothetical protein
VAWAFLRQHFGYFRGADFRTQTNIEMDPSCNPAELNRINQAIIHFEPVLDMLTSNLDPNRGSAGSNTNRGHGYWRNEPYLTNRTRREAIQVIEQSTASQQSLNSQSPRVFCNDPHPKTVDDLIQWAEFQVSHRLK